MIGRLIRRFLREEEGVTLVMAIAAMAILAITTTGVIIAGTANEQTAWSSTRGRMAFAIAQEALAYGEGMVYGDVESSPSVVPPTSIQYLPAQPGGATGTYQVFQNGTAWHVVGIGTVGGVSRTVSADVTPTEVVTQQSAALWNYLYEDAPNPPCVAGGAVITMPIMARGNFCESGNGTTLLNTLEVAGNLTVSGNANIGSSSSPIAKLRVGGTCAANASAVTPGTSPCDGSHNSVYAASVNTTLDLVPSMPVVDFQGAYNTQAALTKTGCPANLFDNDTTRNNSDTSITSVMFGSTAYDCFVGTNELRWTPSTNSLYVHGTFYFDGTLNFQGHVVYSGQASMYFTGGVSTYGGSGSTLCGIANCTTSWDPNQNLLVMVAQCTGLTSKCVDLEGGASVQFAAYVLGEYYVAGGSGNMGPILCNTFTITGGTNVLIPFNNFPPGTPTNTQTTQVYGTPPVGWSG